MPRSDQHFTRFYSTHVAFVWRCALALGVPSTDVDDAVQEIFLVAQRRLSSYDGSGSERAWLYGITRRVSHRVRRTQSRHQRRVSALADVGAAPAEVEDRVAWREATTRVLAFLEALPSDKRQAFVLSDVEGLTRNELADALGVNPNTAWARVRSARAELARTFGEADPGVLRSLLDGVAVDLTPAPERRHAVLVAIVAHVPRAAIGTTAMWLAPAVLVVAGVVAAAVVLRPSPVPATEHAAIDPPRAAAPTIAPSSIPPAALAQPSVAVHDVERPAAPPVVAPARARSTAIADPAPPIDPPGLARETELVLAARASLRADDSATTLARLAELEREFPASTYAPEASALRIAALCSGDPVTARAHWRAHRERWPTSPGLALVRNRCGEAWLDE